MILIIIIVLSIFSGRYQWLIRSYKRLSTHIVKVFFASWIGQKPIVTPVMTRG